MSAYDKIKVALACVALVLLAVLGRYEVVIGSRGDGLPPGYLLDRWTGAVQQIHGAQLREVARVPWEDFKPVDAQQQR